MLYCCYPLWHHWTHIANAHCKLARRGSFVLSQLSASNAFGKCSQTNWGIKVAALALVQVSTLTHSWVIQNVNKPVCVCVCVQLTASIAAKWKKNEANLWAAPQASTGSTGYAYSIRCEWSECVCVRGDSLSMCIIALYCVVCVFIYLCRRSEGGGAAALSHDYCRLLEIWLSVVCMS